MTSKNTEKQNAIRIFISDVKCNIGRDLTYPEIKVVERFTMANIEIYPCYYRKPGHMVSKKEHCNQNKTGRPFLRSPPVIKGGEKTNRALMNIAFYFPYQS